MPKPSTKSLLHQQMTRREFLAFGALAAISVFGFIGVIEELLSHAATPYASGQAQSGTRSGTTALATTTGSASSQVVQFGTPPASGKTPAYSPPGGVGALLFNADYSTLSNQAGAGPWFASTPGSTDNDITGNSADVNVVNGQLVLTLSATNSGGQVTACPASDGTFPTPSNGGFSFTYGYVECSLVVPNAGWWAVWLSGDPWPTHGEFDIAENANTVYLETNYHSSSGSVNGGGYPNQPTAGETVAIGGLWQSGVVSSYLNGVHQITLNNGDGGITIADNAEFPVLTMGSYTSVPQYLKVNYLRIWALP